MKKKFLVILVLLFFAVGMSNLVLAYDVANELRFPLDNYSRRNNILGTYNHVGNNKYHLGEDVIAVSATRVYAIGNGKIRKAYEGTGYGGMYIIEHTLASGEKILSLYAHLNFATFTKQAGDDVSKGDFLGEIGTTAQNGGWGEHLHFGIKKGGYPSNPNEYVCGDWIFSGYTACESIIGGWYDPSWLISNQLLRLPYRQVGNVAWYPPNKSCIFAERWKYFDSNCDGMNLNSNDICHQEQNKMIIALGGIGSNWQEIIFGFSDLNNIQYCSQ